MPIPRFTAKDRMEFIERSHGAWSHRPHHHRHGRALVQLQYPRRRVATMTGGGGVGSIAPRERLAVLAGSLSGISSCCRPL
jgi:hypothetical protein